MGYIPPVRDEQLFQYGNRLNHHSQGITPTSPVIKGTFHNVLTEKQKQLLIDHKKYHHQKKKKNLNYEIIQEVTGKGYYINESV